MQPSRGRTDPGGLGGEVATGDGRIGGLAPGVSGVLDELAQHAELTRLLTRLRASSRPGAGPRRRGRAVRHGDLAGTAGGERQADLDVGMGTRGQHAEKLEDEPPSTRSHHHGRVGLLALEHAQVQGLGVEGGPVAEPGVGMACGSAGPAALGTRLTAHQLQPCRHEGRVLGAVVDPSDAGLRVTAADQRG
ncbi:hypothetical protein ACFFX0_23130 [Citricoccus parietis]|uniref:PilZ domain-containing protein n=1 Tax=Citricoccus parietis TaxID=592307 RepID=A0ABV5G4S1_9MICC